MNPEETQAQTTETPAQSTSESGFTEKMIPYKNKKALMAYYFGVFGLIPIFGLALSVAAIVLGKMGLNYHKQYPETHGKTHAIVGLVLGIFELVIFALFVLFVLFSASTDS